VINRFKYTHRGGAENAEEAQRIHYRERQHIDLLARPGYFDVVNSFSNRLAAVNL
jgi:hypothetical protein